jgi:hypothetical protein
MFDPTILPQVISALAHQAEADAAPYRERSLGNGEVLELAAEFSAWRLPPDGTVEGDALRACYDLVFRCAATPPGSWQCTPSVSHP